MLEIDRKSFKNCQRILLTFWEERKIIKITMKIDKMFEICDIVLCK